jgi:hypothetical protein
MRFTDGLTVMALLWGAFFVSVALTALDNRRRR